MYFYFKIMSAFLNSLIRQLGRDSGRVITNKVFGDAHAAPVRIIRGGQIPTPMPQSMSAEKRRSIVSKFDNALGFQRSDSPENLVEHMLLASLLFEDEVESFLHDDYFSPEETQIAFQMMHRFTRKAESVVKQLSFEEEQNSQLLDKLEQVVVRAKQDFEKLLDRAADASERMVPILEKKAAIEGKFNFFKWVLYNTFYMRGYAKTGQLKIVNTVLANLLLPGTQLIMFAIGLLSSPFEYAKYRKIRKYYQEQMVVEQQRASELRDIRKYQQGH